MPTLVASWDFRLLEPWIDPEHARTQALQFAPNLTVKRGALIAQLTANGQGTPYVPGGSGGAGKWLFISRYDFTTDANGLVVFGPAGSTPGLHRPAAGTELVFWRGAFLVSQLAVGAAPIDGTAITLASVLTDGPIGTRTYGPPIGTAPGPFFYIP